MKRDKRGREEEHKREGEKENGKKRFSKEHKTYIEGGGGKEMKRSTYKNK